MKERYEIIKKLYPDYLILIKHKDKINFLGTDKLIVDIFKYNNLKNVNKLILDNLDIEIKEEYKNNEYNSYLNKVKLIEIVKQIGMRLDYEK